MGRRARSHRTAPNVEYFSFFSPDGSPRNAARQSDTASQWEPPAQVYIETQPLIRSVVDGYNVCIFAYGQTGSGKTHTMAGTNIADVKGRGINYRALDDLFDLQHQRRAEVQYKIRVQMLEVYNEQVCGLCCICMCCMCIYGGMHEACTCITAAKIAFLQS